MLTIYGESSRGGRISSERFCDGLHRRTFLKIGGLALGGLSLPQLLEAESTKDRTSPLKSPVKSGKSVNMIYLAGGPPHQDMFDLKLDAPSEIRGEFKPIKTNVPGIEICEEFPRLAAMMDKLAVIRSLVGSDGRHDSFQCLTGRRFRGQPPGGWPEFGSVVSRLQGFRDPGVPPYVNLAPIMRHKPYNAKGPGFLGQAHGAFRPEGEAREDMALNGITLERLGDRRRLLGSFDRFRRHADRLGEQMQGVDAFQSQALGVLTSSKLVEALDLGREDPRVIDRYGKGTPREQGDAAPRLMKHFLLARRLVEAGARFVTCTFSFWDWHGSNFAHARKNFPDLDQGVSALVEDLYQRGLDKDVSVIVWGEFGRTPKINKGAGRDHWPNVTCALLAGGGMKTGQVIGSTDRLGAEAEDRPVHFQEVFATLYHQMGIDVDTATVQDFSGRPRYLVDDTAKPMPELI